MIFHCGTPYCSPFLGIVVYKIMVTVIGITSLTNTPLFWALCVLLTQKQAQFLFGNNNHFMAQITNEILHKCSAAQFIGKIVLFTDTAAILNLLDLRSIIGWPGGTQSVFTCAFLAKRTSLYISREKGDHYYIQTQYNDHSFPITIIF